MTPQLEEAARRIVSARTTHTPFAGLPAGLQPRSEAVGYDLQDMVRDQLIAAGQGRLVGYKIGCTTRVMQEYLGIDHPCAGNVLARGLLRSGAVLPSGVYVRPGIECELAVELWSDLTPAQAPFDAAKVAAAVGGVFAAIEVVDDRYVHWRSLDAPTLIADDFFHAGLVLGRRQTGWPPVTLAADLSGLAGIAWVNGQEVGRGRGADILGNPLEALAWLANHCARRGVTMPRGTLVSLGSLIETHWLEPGDVVDVEIERLGPVKLTYSDR
ncbi:MAG: fumarylacetoacetate hydrolase family protein [Rhodospirillaceae bacterium]|nr:fumarylacetoacetate hydrolase family protein [Rhodospirillaceae bacterium]